MVDIRISFGQTTTSMVIEGHAGAGSKGTDIVCSAVSILAQTVMQEASNLAAKSPDGAFRVVRMQRCEGKIRLDTEAIPARQEQWLTALCMARTGFGMLEEAYPSHVKLTWVAEGR